MKKYLCILIAVILLFLSACNTDTPKKPGAEESSATKNETTAVTTTEATTTETTPEATTTETTPETTTEATTTEATETDISEEVLLPLPSESAEFSFLSGAGAWRTVMTLNRDGTFTGWYLDSEMGDIGEGYPNGSAYTCTFSGRFVNVEKLDEYSYKMTLTDVETEKEVGEEWIENDIRYIASEPQGLNDPLGNQICTDFVFYLPETPVDQLPEEFLFWWPYRYFEGEEAKTTLSCYGILNVISESGFFTAE